MPGQADKIRIGTSGWSYDDWQGVVYPERARLDQLAYLSGYFDTFEVNSSFYRPPSARMTASWVRRTGEQTEFTFKLHRRFTHLRESPYTRAALEEFRRGIDPVARAGRLGALLAQFPWSFRFDEPARFWLERLARDFRSYRLAVEVRHVGWKATEAMDFLRSRGLNVACVDQPQMRGNLPPLLEPTGPVGYVRLHGRNAEQWFASMRAPQQTPEQRQAARNARYDYLYSEAELTEWAGRIVELAGRTERTYVFANNHFRGLSAANALQLKSMILNRPVPVPEPMIEAFEFLARIAEKKPRQRSLF